MSPSSQCFANRDCSASPSEVDDAIVVEDSSEEVVEAIMVLTEINGMESGPLGPTLFWCVLLVERVVDTMAEVIDFLLTMLIGENEWMLLMQQPANNTHRSNVGFGIVVLLLL